MPVLMPLLEKNSAGIRRVDLPGDERTMDASLGEVVEFGPQGIHARGSNMTEAVLAAVEQVWNTLDEIQERATKPDGLSWARSGEIDVPTTSAAQSPYSAGDVAVIACRHAEDRGLRDDAQSVLRGPVSDVCQGLSAGLEGQDAFSDRVLEISDGFSEKEEAFFDGYEPEESLGREELMSLFDPAGAWKERHAGRDRVGAKQAERRRKFRLFSLIW